MHYDPARGYAFSTYAWATIRHRLWRAHFYADRVEDDKNEAAEAWLELVKEIEEDWWQQHVRQSLLEVEGRLPERLGRLIRLAYGLDGQGTYCLAEIGREWGLSRERIRQLRNDALALLRLPALFMHLRSLFERDSRQAYQQASGLNRAWQRSQRKRR
jgi:RNA polymerase sigma factor (sigma-70 family)